MSRFIIIIILLLIICINFQEFSGRDPALKIEFLLNKNKSAATFFNTLSFTNKKEYVEWIVTAKKAETRNERLNETIKRLQLQWKNPRNI